MSAAFDRYASRRSHLESANLLRSLTEVINKVSGGINLGQGVCDLDSPEPLRQGAIDCVTGRTDRQVYTPYAGIPELRAQIATKLRGFNGLQVEAAQVAVTAGSSAAFFAAGMTLLEPGDEVVLFEPFYSYHHTSLRLLGAKPVCVPLQGPDFELDLGRLKAVIGPRTRAVLVNTPANPSGKIFDLADLQGIATLLDGSDVMLWTDEVYEYMCFDGRRHISPGTVPGLTERCLTIGGFSKTYSITGWRVGYLAGPEEVVERIGKVFDQMDVCAARPMQRGVERALAELPADFYAELQAGYQRKRDQFCAALEAGGWGYCRPQGAYYVMADYQSVLGDLDPHAAVLRLIETRRVNAVPGHLFYAEAEGVRSLCFHFAVRQDLLDEVCERLAGT